REQRFKQILIAGLVLVVLFITAIVAAMFAIINTREANNQRALAEKSALEANNQKKEADNQRSIAEKNAKEAYNQKEIAEKNAKEAYNQKLSAEKNLNEANKQRAIAEENASLTTKRQIQFYQELGRSKLLNNDALSASLYLSEAYRISYNNRKTDQYPVLLFLLAQAMKSIELQKASLQGHSDIVYSAAFS